MRTAPLLRTLLTLVLAGVVAGPSSAAAQEPSADPAGPPEGFVLDGDPQRGRSLFQERCALCHGAEGAGDGRIQTNPPPRDLRNPETRVARTDWETYRVIRDGGPALGLSKKMFGWGRMLEEKELRDLAAWVQSLADVSP